MKPQPMSDIGPLFAHATTTRARRALASAGLCPWPRPDWPQPCGELSIDGVRDRARWRARRCKCAAVPKTFDATIRSRRSRARAHAYPLARMRRRARLYIVLAKGMLVKGVPMLDKRRSSPKR